MKTTLHRICEDFGSQTAAAKHFGTTREYINSILNGHRCMGKTLALRIEKKSRGKYRADDLVFNR